MLKWDWHVYIGHGLNNKHWVLEKSKWSNPFYMAKLSAKMCNERYRRHILSSKHLLGSLKELVGKGLGCQCPNLDDCHGNVLIELVHEFFPSESEMRGYVLCHQYLVFKGQRSPLSNCCVHDIKMQGGTFINVHQMYGWKEATALGERFVAKNILEVRDSERFSSYLRPLQVEMCHRAWRTLYIGCFSSYVKSGIPFPSFEMSVSTTCMSCILKQQQIHFVSVGWILK